MARKKPAGTRRFHHVGLRAIEPQPNENFVESTRVWVTDPNHHPFKIEYLRYEPDSYLSEEFRNTPHIGFVVDEIEPWMKDKEIAIPPFEVGDPPFVRVVFVYEDGLICEYMAFVPDAVWFDPSDAGTQRASGSETS